MKAKVAFVALALLACASVRANDSVRIGSKNFTESIVLAEILRLDAERDALKIDHLRALGGSAILWKALLDGSIDAYPEYTGTITHELLTDLPQGADAAALAAALQKLGIGIGAPLGFEDRYALGVTQELANRLSLQTLSDLRAHPDLRYGLSNEFTNRGDGWPGLVAKYSLTPASVKAMDHSLVYRALASSAVDVVDLYTTDAEIRNYHIEVLADDRHYFPAYDAVWLYRLDTAQRTPLLLTAIQSLSSRISLKAMQNMNAAVMIDKRSETLVAAEFLGVDNRSDDTAGLWHSLWSRTIEHLELVGVSLGAAIAIGLPLGIFASRRKRLGQVVLAGTAILQTIPSLAMFVFLIPVLGIGAKPAIAALFFYSLLPIVRNTVSGIASIPAALQEAAASLGLPPGVRLVRIELPLAARTIVAGIGTAAVIDVGTATLGALIGAGGYGEPILTGIRLGSIPLLLEGAIPAAMLALLVLALFQGLERLLVPRGLRLPQRS
jgi:osmoprotectant transport system permease protein